MPLALLASGPRVPHPSSLTTTLQTTADLAGFWCTSYKVRPPCASMPSKPMLSVHLVVVPLTSMPFSLFPPVWTPPSSIPTSGCAAGAEGQVPAAVLARGPIPGEPSLCTVQKLTGSQ